jgi:hypothetical protein
MELELRDEDEMPDQYERRTAARRNGKQTNTMKARKVR